MNIDGQNLEYELIFDGVNYVANVPTTKTGKYDVEISYFRHKDDAEPLDKINEPVYFDYSKEYDIFTNETNDVMFNVAKKAAGNFSEDGYEYKASEAELNSTSYISTMMVFMLITVIIFLADVFVRKSDFIRKKKVDVAKTSLPQA